MLFLILLAFFPWRVCCQGGCTFHQSFPVCSRYISSDTSRIRRRFLTFALLLLSPLFKLTNCFAYSYTFTLVETAIVDGTPYKARPTVVTLDLETGTFSLTVIFPSLPLTKFTPGQTVTIVFAPITRLLTLQVDDWGTDLLIESLTTHNGVTSIYAESSGVGGTHTYETCN